MKKILVRIGIGILILIAIPLIIALFVTKDYAVEKEIIINKPKQEVFDYVKLLKNQDHYSEWVRMDPKMKKEFRGTDGTVGFVYAWDGNSDAGKGEQEIMKITEGERIDVEIRFEKPMGGVGNAPIILESVSGEQTKVRWGMNGKSKYPFNFMNLFMDKMMGGVLEKSLNTLKANIEK